MVKVAIGILMMVCAVTLGFGFRHQLIADTEGGIYQINRWTGEITRINQFGSEIIPRTWEKQHAEPWHSEPAAPAPASE